MSTYILLQGGRPEVFVLRGEEEGEGRGRGKGKGREREERGVRKEGGEGSGRKGGEGEKGGQRREWMGEGRREEGETEVRRQ